MLLLIHRSVKQGGLRGLASKAAQFRGIHLKSQRRYNFGGGRQDDGNSNANPLEFVKDFRRDVEMFPEYFNPVTYTIFTLIMVYLLFVTSNQRARKWFYKHCSLSQENLKEGRMYTTITHSLLETSFVSLALNLALVRWGGNMVMNLGSGEAGFVRALGILSFCPGMLYTAGMATSNSANTATQYLEVGGAVVPTSHFTTTEPVSGLHAISAGLVANGVMEAAKRFPSSTVLGIRAPSALPILTAAYIILATSGSSDSWLSLCGVATAVSYRFFFKTGF
eukprot:TRINITY_DN4829_c0_g1_i2.p1 TRINITY_DN4829_c0_g1~~TRINITY_DN4829_c0_g1_i2.p1  ORF type:complete len:296 (+),score=49.10 TRINITY_DN4829_c0_g1_i2:53-889(+)